jgi:Uma2 family endonuclease
MENEVKEPALKYNYTTTEEYLEFERSSILEKHELHEGTVITMTGASLKHNQIVRNLIGAIHPFLKGKCCSVFPSDLRTKVLTKDSFTYPDVSIVCGKPELLDEHFDTLLNPSVIIEVLSPSTEKYDKGFKFFNYMQIPSLKEYIIISSTETYIHVSRKLDDSSWKFDKITDPDSSLFINTIEHNISLHDIYDEVSF